MAEKILNCKDFDKINDSPYRTRFTKKTQNRQLDQWVEEMYKDNDINNKYSLILIVYLENTNALFHYLGLVTLFVVFAVSYVLL